MPKQSKADWRKWTPERRANYYATINAKREAKLKAAKHHTIAISKRNQHGIEMPVLVMARRLRASILTHITISKSINDVELNALLLVNELLKPKE